MTHHQSPADQSPAEIAASLDHRSRDILSRIVRFDGAATFAELEDLGGFATLSRLRSRGLLTHGNPLWRVTDLGRAVVRNT